MLNIFLSEPAPLKCYDFKNLVNTMNDLEQLANLHGSDKGSKDALKTKHHRYTDIYYFLFREFRQREVVFLELGAFAQGGTEQGGDINIPISSLPSAQMWAEFMPNAQVHVFEIRELSEDVSLQGNISFHCVDLGDSEKIASGLSEIPNSIDIVIDDASHASFHQLNALLNIWFSLNYAGLYIIEDLHWQPPVLEKSLPSVPVIKEIFEEGYVDKLPDYLRDPFNSFASEVSCFTFVPSLVPHHQEIKKLLVIEKQNCQFDLTICCAFDVNLLDAALISLLSFQENSGIKIGFVLCIDESISFSLLGKFFRYLRNVRILRVNSLAVKNKYMAENLDWSFHPQFHPATFYRFELFKDVSLTGRCLYVDVDTLCLGDLQSLKDMSFREHEVIGACSVMRPMKENALLLNLDDEHKYFNAGVLLFDAEKIRDIMGGQVVQNMLKENRDIYFYADQCLLNHLLKGRIKWLDKRYNTLSWFMNIKSVIPNRPMSLSDSFSPKRIKKSAKILHFAGNSKPWDAADSESWGWGIQAWHDFKSKYNL